MYYKYTCHVAEAGRSLSKTMGKGRHIIDLMGPLGRIMLDYNDFRVWWFVWLVNIVTNPVHQNTFSKT